jgi:putative hydroxymethylpyrimidine transport system permease protein|tara:strand:- start:9510 stop:10301 length:792 start_codon:yes stop_codon:yes gene_type:complete
VNARVTAIGRAVARFAWDNVAVVAIVAAWALWVVIGQVNRVVMPSPASVLADLVGHPDAYLPDLTVSAGLAATGLVLGQLLGIGLAIAAHLSGVVRAAVRPAVLIVRAVPMVAMVPIFARIVGYGTPTVLVVATLVAYFPAFVLVSRGLASASRSKQDLLTVLGASRWTRFRRLDLPAAVPSLLEAFRLSAVGSVVGVLLAEFVVGSSGLGQLFVVSRVSYDMSRSWGAAIVATVLSLAFFGLASAVTRWLEAAYHDGSNGKG